MQPVIDEAFNKLITDSKVVVADNVNLVNILSHYATIVVRPTQPSITDISGIVNTQLDLFYKAVSLTNGTKTTLNMDNFEKENVAVKWPIYNDEGKLNFKATETQLTQLTTLLETFTNIHFGPGSGDGPSCFTLLQTLPKILQTIGVLDTVLSESLVSANNINGLASKTSQLTTIIRNLKP
jgi:hypothetical protein